MVWVNNGPFYPQPPKRKPQAASPKRKTKSKYGLLYAQLPFSSFQLSALYLLAACSV
jgi:hypothetical protein